MEQNEGCGWIGPNTPATCLLKEYMNKMKGDSGRKKHSGSGDQQVGQGEPERREEGRRRKGRREGDAGLACRLTHRTAGVPLKPACDHRTTAR